MNSGKLITQCFVCNGLLLIFNSRLLYINSFNFTIPNCFTLAIENEDMHERRIISFEHPSYKLEKLELIVIHEHKKETCFLDNIISGAWWVKQVKPHTWTIEEKYKIEVRYRDHNPPHFHITWKEYKALLSIETGKLLEGSIPPGDNKIIEQWYNEHKNALLDCWNKFHSNISLEKKP